ncbi:hypothetical protein BaRGS_00013392, partial [Batillaria attramentaria]
VLFCFWDASKNLECQTHGSGYQTGKLDKNNVTVRIDSATEHHVGRYMCQVIPSAPDATVPCNFSLTDSEPATSTESQTSDETTQPGKTGDNGNKTRPVIIAVAIAVPVLVVVLVVCFAIVYRKRRQTRSRHVPAAVEHSKSEAEPLNDPLERSPKSEKCTETSASLSPVRYFREEISEVKIGSDTVNFSRGVSRQGGNIIQQSSLHPEKDSRHSETRNVVLAHRRGSRDVAKVDSTPYDRALNALQRKNAVVLVGPEKCGKTTISRRLLQHYANKGYIRINVARPIKWWTLDKDPDTKYVVFLDEAIQTNDAVRSREMWSRCFDDFRKRQCPAVVTVQSTETNENELRASLFSFLKDVPVVLVPKRTKQ